MGIILPNQYQMAEWGFRLGSIKSPLKRWENAYYKVLVSTWRQCKVKDYEETLLGSCFLFRKGPVTGLFPTGTLNFKLQDPQIRSIYKLPVSVQSRFTLPPQMAYLNNAMINPSPTPDNSSPLA